MLIYSFPHLRASRSSLSAALVLSLAACTVGPDYRRPAIDTVTLHNTTLLEQRNAAAPMPPLDRWWEGFNDPALSNIVRKALAQNLDLAASLARVEQARAAAQGAGANRLPQGQLNADAARAKQSLQSPLGKIASNMPGYERTQTLYDINAGASWELDLAGALQRGAEAADAELQAAEAQHVGVRISIAAEAADAYFRIRGAQARIALTQRQIRNGEELVRLVRLRLQEGLGSITETAQADAQLAQVRSMLPPLRTEQEKQLNRLDVLMGTAPGTYARTLAQQDSVDVTPSIHVDADAATLMRRRPDVIAAERRLAAANARIGVAMAAYYPTVSLSTLAGFQSLGAAGLFGANSVQAQAGLGLRWRLFDFGRIDAEIAGAKGAYAQSLSLYRQSLLHAAEDVENAIMALVQLEEQTRELDTQVHAQQRARTNVEEAFKGGISSLADVLIEERLLITAQDQLAQTRSDSARAAVSTFRALGGGW